MKKVLGYIVVLFVFSSATTVNAGPIAASITNSNGVSTIDGFSSLASDGDGDPSTINFSLDYTKGSMVRVIEPITMGTLYHVEVGGDIITLGSSFSAYFGRVSQNNIDPGSASIDTILDRLIPSPFSVSGSPLGSLTVLGNKLDLLSVTVGPSLAGYTLKLATQVTKGTALNILLNSLDPNGNGSLTGEFTNAHLEITQVPEPTTLLLLCTGLLGILSFSTKRA